MWECCRLPPPVTVGDHALFQCLWRAGIAPTDPGYSLRNPGAMLFDALDGSTERLAELALRTLGGGANSSEAGSSGQKVAATAGTADSADGDEAAFLGAMVSLHLTGARYCSSTAAVQMMGRAFALHSAWREATAAASDRSRGGLRSLLPGRKAGAGDGEGAGGARAASRRVRRRAAAVLEMAQGERGPATYQGGPPCIKEAATTQ